MLTAVAVEQRHERLARSSKLHGSRTGVLTVGVVLFAVYHLALALFMAVAPHAFFANVGPFGARNDHYIRDTATFNAAIGIGFAIAVRHRSWRVPVLVIAVAQFTLHSINHLVDIDKAHPAWNGYVDFFSLAAATLLLAWLLRAALADAKPSHPTSRGAPQ
jgi:hypothetical protein